MATKDKAVETMAQSVSKRRVAMVKCGPCLFEEIWCEWRVNQHRARVSVIVKLQFATMPKGLDRKLQECNQKPHEDESIRIHIYARSAHTYSVAVCRKREARDRYVWLAKRDVCVPDCA